MDMDGWPPNADDVVALPVDELALRLLGHFVANNMNQVHRVSSTSINRSGPEYASVPVRRSIAETFDWLYLRGLIALPHDHGAGEWYYVTERGRQAADDANALAAIRAVERLGVDLHPALAQRVRSQFLLGEHESAVLLAFRAVEIRVGDLGAFDTSSIGVPLMMNAFNPDKSGPLADPKLDAGEQKATQFLFAGAIGAFKNPSSHRQVDYGDPTVAAEAVLLADLLMRLLDRYDDPTSQA